MIVPLVLFAQLAASCAANAHVDTLAAIARTESGFDANAIHDNATGRSYFPKTSNDAIAIATHLITIERHGVDLGLMQVNNANLQRFGITIADSFDPCTSLNIGARILSAGYAPPPPNRDVQPALLQAISRYNTGHPTRGFSNGYVERVRTSADQVVPAIQVRTPSKDRPEKTDVLPPPSWDVFGQARFTRARAGVAGSSNPGTTQPLLAPVARQPIALQGMKREAIDAQ